MFDSLRIPYQHEVLAFGENWCGPHTYEMYKEQLVARYESSDENDGQTVEVYCTIAPARFYTIKVLEGRDSVGNKKAAYAFQTGSGLDMAKLAANMGEAISEGMLGLDE